MEIIGTLILIIPILILVLSPLILYIARRVKRNKTAASEQASTAAAKEVTMEMTEPVQTRPVKKTRERVQYTSEQFERQREPAVSPKTGNRRIDMLPRLKRAILWAEILGPPRSLQDK